MSKKLRSGFFALVAAVFALAVLIAPKTAWAIDNATVCNQDGIYVYIDTTSPTAAIPQSVRVTVNVDGEKFAEQTVTNIPTSGSNLKINASGYLVESVDTNVYYFTASDRGNGVYSLGFSQSLKDETYELTVNLAKTSRDITIADDNTTYGTFSWSKQSATNFDYERTVTIVVNDREAYSQTVQTPQQLSNGGGSNQYWFTPNSELYNLSDVSMTPAYSLDTAANRNVTIELTTKCPCGSDTCMCPGGVDCPCFEDCTCDYCTGKVFEEEGREYKLTPYGVIQYTPEEDGYKMTVNIFVNGEQQKEYDLGPIGGPATSAGSATMDLDFTVADGYNYMEGENSYDIITKNDGSSWVPSTGDLTIVGVEPEDKNFDNQLNIYLWTFKNYVNLDVDRLVGGPMDKVTGYVISYEAFDPASGTMKTYTYDATSFSGAQRQIIPTNTVVTLTAICDEGYEAQQWHVTAGGSCSLNGEDGGSITAGWDYAYGNEVYLNVTDTTISDIQVWIDRVKDADGPSDQEVIDALKNSAVTVVCDNNFASHHSVTFGLLQNSFDITDVYEKNGGKRVDVKITDSNAYITAFAANYGEVKHEFVSAVPDDMTITFKHDGTQWAPVEGENPITINVTCDVTPELPTDDDIVNLLGEIFVVCVNDNAGHLAAPYSVIKDSYTRPVPDQLSGDETNGYTYTVTVNAKKYVAQYSTDTKAEHKLFDASKGSVEVTLINKGDGWTVQSGTPVSFEVVCEDVPTPPTIDELASIKGADVTVNCTGENNHDSATYDPKSGAYTLTEPVKNAQGVYTVDMTVTPYAYVADFNKTNGEHTYADGEEVSKSVTLAYDAATKNWSVAGTPISYNVECVVEEPVDETPDMPTPDVVKDLLANGAVTIDCINANVDHANVTYPVVDGAYTIGEVVEANGQYTSTITVRGGHYVLEFEKAHEGIHHWLDPDTQAEKTITLVYDATTGEWTLPAGAAPVTFTVMCADEPVVDPGTDPEPGTDPDQPGGDEEPGDDQKPGDDGNKPGDDQKPGDDGNKPGDQPGGNDAAPSAGIPKTGDPTSVIAAVATAFGGVALVGASAVVRKRQK